MLQRSVLAPRLFNIKRKAAASIRSLCFISLETSIYKTSGKNIGSGGGSIEIVYSGQSVNESQGGFL